MVAIFWSIFWTRSWSRRVCFPSKTRGVGAPTGSLFDSENGDQESPTWCSFFAPDAEVMAAWSWYNFLKTTMPANTVHINMDETHIPIFPGFQQGVMIKQREPRRIGRWMACATVPKKYRQGGICHCAFVADNRDSQDLLPQLLLIPRRLCTVRRQRTVCQRNVCRCPRVESLQAPGGQGAGWPSSGAGPP